MTQNTQANCGLIARAARLTITEQLTLAAGAAAMLGNVTGAASLNVLKTGDTMTGDLISPHLNVSKTALKDGMVGTLAFADFVIVAGSWPQSNNAAQSDWDDSFVTQAGIIGNSTSANLDEIKIPNLLLNAGTYVFTLSTIKNSDAGILELLHGTNSIGTSDLYNAVAAYNNIITFTYSPTTRVAADLRIRSNGKNAAATQYTVRVSRIQIMKTA